jgi:sugar/nucleoside kinase (ribokinase family)
MHAHTHIKHTHTYIHIQVSPGGSVANTLVAIARLSAASGGPPVRVSMAGSVGTDALGCYFNAQVCLGGGLRTVCTRLMWV